MAGGCGVVGFRVILGCFVGFSVGRLLMGLSGRLVFTDLGVCGCELRVFDSL